LRISLQKSIQLPETVDNDCEKRLLNMHLWIDKMLRDDTRKALLSGDRLSARVMISKISKHVFPKDMILTLLSWMPASVSLLARHLRQSIIRKPASYSKAEGRGKE
jgi:hypothetical protein